MSRLDSFIRRLQAQKACLEQAARLIEPLRGPILEIGLGNGRTYDHLRELFPNRAIFVFDKRVAGHPHCIPDSKHLILGDICETLLVANQRIAQPAALAHVDCGTGDASKNARLMSDISDALLSLMGKNSVIVSDQKISSSLAHTLSLPEGVAPGRYFMYQC